MGEFRLLPEQASTLASRTDALFAFLCAMSAFFTALIFLLIVYFAVKHRRRSAVPPPPTHASHLLELVWIVIPLVISMVIYFWGAHVYFFAYRPPQDAMDVYVIGKQWMWKIQHPGGQREINELHVPLNRPVRLIISSQDVIHSFFLPAFRVKQDAVPGRYSILWFEATKLGQFHLFCAEYCGALHSQMVGRVVVMEPEKYQSWLAGYPVDETPAEAGGKLFSSLGCMVCHGSKAPTLAGLYRSQVKLADGRTVMADEVYLREAILDSAAKVVAGYAPIMPSFRGQVSEEQLLALIAYIKSLQNPELLRREE